MKKSMKYLIAVFGPAFVVTIIEALIVKYALLNIMRVSIVGVTVLAFVLYGLAAFLGIIIAEKLK